MTRARTLALVLALSAVASAIVTRDVLPVSVWSGLALAALILERPSKEATGAAVGGLKPGQVIDGWMVTETRYTAASDGSPPVVVVALRKAP